jgi:hypothetical protein
MKCSLKLFNFLIYIVYFYVLTTIESCSIVLGNDKQFEQFYQDAEYKFIDCLKYGSEKYNKSDEFNNCKSTEEEIKKLFEKNGIKADAKILSASIYTQSCGYSKYGGQPEKPLFDKTIYQIIHQKDTSIILVNDTIKYNVDIRKTIVHFTSKNNHFETKLDIVIPKSINMTKVLF